MSETRISPGGTCTATATSTDAADPTSTDHLLSSAATKAGLPEKLVTLNDRATYRDTVNAQRPLGRPSHDAWPVGAGTLHVGPELGETLTHGAHVRKLASFFGKAALAGAALEMFETAKMLPDAWARGDERQLALERDARFAALVLTVRGLPPAYVRRETGERRPEATMAAQSHAHKIVIAMDKVPRARELLQVRVDEGMRAAEGCLAARLSRGEYMKTRPDVGRRYALDAAFRVGFDAVTFAQVESETSLAQTLMELRQRDARCASNAPLVLGG